jgi:hypothetical protein
LAYLDFANFWFVSSSIVVAKVNLSVICIRSIISDFVLLWIVVSFFSRQPTIFIKSKSPPFGRLIVFAPFLIIIKELVVAKYCLCFSLSRHVFISD